MILLLWFGTLMFFVNGSTVKTTQQDISLALVKTLQNQLQICMHQNAELVRRSCKGGNNSTHVIEPSKRYSIAFHTGLSKDVKNLPHNYKLVFDKVYLNEGNAYDYHTGVFTCPRDGIYVFHWTILTVAGKYFFTDFMVNGHAVGRSYPKAATLARAASSTVVQRLKKGDKAWIEPHHTYIGQFAHHGWCFYSGYML